MPTPAPLALQDADAYKATAAHVELAKKMMKRDSATAPTVGERVAYVIVKGVRGAKASDKAEDPIYALENNLPIDAQHYLDHHLTQPLMRIFEPILGEKKAKSLLSGIFFCYKGPDQFIHCHRGLTPYPSVATQ
jgi:DNA polymerase delta subunit 1